MAGGMGGGLGPRGFLTEAEKANMPKITKKLILRILSYLKPYIFQFILVFVTILISSLVGLLPSMITGKIVDEALVGRDLALLIKLLIFAFLALAGSQIIGVLENYINSWISSRIIFDMKNQMYRHLQHMPHSFFTTEKQGDIITRMNTDISGVSSVISGTLSSIVSNVATVATTLVALFTMSWQLALVGLLVLPLLILPTKSVGKQRFKLLNESQAKHDEMNQVINETLSVSGSLLTKLFTREDKEYESFVKINEEVTNLSMKEQRSGSWFRVAMGLFTQLGPLLIYFAGGLIIINCWDSALTVGTVTAVVALVNRLYRPVESLLNIGVDFTRSLALFTRIFDYFDRENTIVAPENGLKPEVKDQDITYEHVAFSYDPEKPLLLDVSFVVPGGKMYAVVGPSGSGKSTVVNFIPRLYDVNAGAVKINGVDVRDMDLTYLRSNIGVVTQETYLFNGTIKENLLYARDNATDEEIMEACKVASIHDFIMSQPKGYDTEVGNRGLKLSGGEKQRLSIARVMLKNPAILILDEATSALDSISESAIQDALERMMKGRTSIVIAHRLSTILKADKILVVKDGVIKEEGSHEELLSMNGVYRELYETQFRDAIEYEASHALTGQAAFDIQALGTDYDVKRITEAEISEVIRFCRHNRHIYRTTGNAPAMRHLTAVISDLSPIVEESEVSGKYFVGFYEKLSRRNGADEDIAGEKKLIAILDLLLDSPEKNEAFIGWFMVDAELQRTGIGSSLFADIRAALKAQGYQKLTLGCPEDSESALAFWEAQGFAKDSALEGKLPERHGHPVIALSRSI